MRHWKPMLERNRLIALCAAAVLACLALPFVVFAAWDARLAVAPQAAVQSPGAAVLSRQGRLNVTACALYDVAYLGGGAKNLGMFGLGEDGWQQASAGENLEQGAQSIQVLELLTDHGLLDGETGAEWIARVRQWQEGQPADVQTLRYALCGLRGQQFSAKAWQGTLKMVCTAEGVPVYFQCETGEGEQEPVRPGALQALLTATGLDEFTDWQVVQWGDAIPNAGESAYSATAQLYATINYRQGLMFSLSSMAPGTFEEFVRQYHVETGGFE